MRKLTETGPSPKEKLILAGQQTQILPSVQRRRRRRRGWEPPLSLRKRRRIRKRKPLPKPLAKLFVILIFLILTRDPSRASTYDMDQRPWRIGFNVGDIDPNIINNLFIVWSYLLGRSDPSGRFVSYTSLRQNTLPSYNKTTNINFTRTAYVPLKTTTFHDNWNVIAGVLEETSRRVFQISGFFI